MEKIARSDRIEQRIDLGGQALVLDDILQDPVRHRKWFELARASHGHARCLCVPGGRRLQIRLREGLYHLAVWPEDALSHHGKCTFRMRAEAETGRAGYGKGAIIEKPDGSVDIHADVPLKVRVEAKTGPTQRNEEPKSGGKTRAKVGMLGMLHSLWERAGLNEWRPGWTRDWWRCRRELINLDGKVNGEPMEDALYCVPAWRESERGAIEAAWAKFRSRLERQSAYRLRGLVVGELKSVELSKYSYKVKLKHHMHAFFVDKAILERAQQSAPSAAAQFDNPGAHIIMIMVVEVTRTGTLKGVDLSFMLTSRDFIPADSSYEMQMADALVDAGRAFTKPLRYDGEAEFPDFRLQDEDGECVVEVWGLMGNPDYELRKEEKIKSYQARGVQVIEWDTRGPMPALMRTAA
ncbi:DUF1173 family protein [Cupriavidus sp. UYPR2.512]|uniref:DUF1173 family protein n=1 Tax=Cupriavidus sp. UYPR2.512 TaxID=1080187 RepID=UPI000380B317|nr:DUF1173 family protein [Cupriavidus sp. UYPR2.512]UIF89251.1 DUF1173 family protein [Cupriavidus necator]